MTPTKINKLYKSWKRILDIISYEYSYDDFLKYLEQYTKNNYGSIYSEQFYSERYFMLDYKYIYDTYKDYTLKNRISVYDPIAISERDGITLEEATKLVNDRKSKTNGKLETYIKRHGEELGRIKYEEFKQKCKSTLENFIERFGEEEGKQRWDNFLSTRDSSSYNFFLKKYNGDEQLAKNEYDKVTTRFKYINSMQYHIDKHGEELGTKIWEDICFKKGYKSTLQYHIEEYGELEGLIKYEQLCNSKKITLEKFIMKYGEELGKIKWNVHIENLKYITSEQYYIDKHGEKEGKILFNKKCEKVYSNNSKSPVSKASINFFESLEKFIGRKLQYGKKCDEFKICDVETGKCYFYDCYDALTNTIIEFNGSNCHADPRVKQEDRDSWIGLRKKGYYFYLDRDINKEKIARSNGYNYIVVWDYEVNAIYKLDEKLQQLKFLK